MPHHYILSTGRTATVAIASDINLRAANGSAVNEPRPRTLTRVLGAFALDGRFSSPWRDSLSRIIPLATVEPKTNVLVETNALVQGMAASLISYSDARCLLHIVREPAQYIHSAVNFGATPLKRPFVWHIPGFETPSIKADVRNRLRKLGFYDVQSREALRYALRWKAVNEHLSELGAALGERYRCVRFEDILYPPYTEYEDTMAWLGLEMRSVLDMSIRRENASVPKVLPSLYELPVPVQTEITSICAPLARDFGYSVQEHTTE